MDQVCVYRVKVKGQMDAGDFVERSPLELVIVRVSTTATLFTFCTDQSGLLGMLRYLHGRGLVLQSIFRKETSC